jgi:DNA segregation ATPase FtsK/SpoIIIE-like protein
MDLRVNRSLELLGNLKQVVSKFAKREDLLSRELNSRRYTTNQKSQEAMDRTDSGYSAQIAETESFFKTEKDRVKAIYEARGARIQRISKVTLRNLPTRAQEVKSRWMGDLQMRTFMAQRKLETDTAAADAAYAAFNSNLEVYRTNLLFLERRARKYFGGYWTLRRMLRPKPGVDPSADKVSSDPFPELDRLFATAQEQLGAFLRFLLPRLFRGAPLPVLFLLILAGGGALAWYLGLNPTAYAIAGTSAAGVFGVIWLIHHLGLIQSKPTALTSVTPLAEIRRIIDASTAAAPARATQLEQDHQRIQQEYDRTYEEIQRQWNRTDDVEKEFATAGRNKVETQAPRILEKIDRILHAKLEHIESGQTAWQERLQGEAAVLKQQITETRDTEMGALVADEKTRWQEIEADWKREIIPIYQEIDAINAEVSPKFPPWDSSLVETWTPPMEFTSATKFGQIDLDLTGPPGAIPKDPRLALPGPPKVSLPLALTFPHQGSLLFETNDSGGATVLGALNNIVLRLLSTTPPGKLSFTLIDPVGLGQSFAGLMHLADYEESLINRRIWTQRDQIEERLAELGEHIEKVIQMYLRNEYATITEYNEQAGSVAEKYHFLVVSDFPANFSDIAAKRLQSIAMSGPRCGIFTLIHWDQRQPLPDGFVPDELRKNSVCLRRTGSEFIINKQQTDIGASLLLDAPPDPDLAVELVHKIGKSSIDSNRVQVAFTQVAPKPDELWTGDTTQELRIAIGRTGATKLQYLAIGKGTRQHALFAGKTGSGKSTLFHVIITNLALACSPEQVQFYLIDFKKGVEFKCYATKHLPHAKVVAIESDREFALSVLQSVDGELRRRGDMFRKLGVQDVAGYKRDGGAEPMPRLLLLIDEFQEFFVEDDTIAQTASLLFDRIVRQGRAFGIHVLLGSQTLGGAYSLARATLGQMVIRVALQCNEADAYLIMDENNSAPRLLSRPGEGIYNDSAGAIEGNSPFQVVWLPDDERDVWLDKVHDLAAQKDRRYPNPIVFEGNAPADIRENDPLRSVLETTPATPPIAARCWLGAPNSIKGPTEVVFQRQNGNHLLIVGQREEASLMMLGVSMLALAAQYPKGAVKFVLFHSAAPGSSEADFMGQIVKAIPHEVIAVQGQDISSAMNDLAAELKVRSAGETPIAEAPAIFLAIHGLHKFKKLRHEDDFSFSMSAGESGPNFGAQLNEIITEGSGHGIHILTTVDTLNSVNRFMNRKALSEFEMRVVFQMSANDSASLIDSPSASNLGLHRALYYNEHEGSLETFRPYAAPDSEWLRQAAEKLAHHAAAWAT